MSSDNVSPDANRSIFAERGFALYFSGQTFSLLGDGLRALVIPLLVFKMTGSALSTGITYALEYLPDGLFGLIGGSLADRLNRRRLMIACDLTRFAIVALFAVLFWRHALTLPVLYAGVVIVSITAAIFLAAEMPSVAYLVGKRRSAKAIAALLATERTANVAAPPLGGALFALGGALPALIVNAFTYLISQFSLVLVPSMGPDEPGPLPSQRQIWSDISEGFRFMHRDIAMTAVVCCALLLLFFQRMATTVLIPFAKIEFGASDLQVGLAFGAIATGSVAGSLLGGATVGRWPFGPAILIAFAIDGLVLVPVIFAHRFWIAIALLMIFGIGEGFEAAQIISWRMRITPDEWIGRVFAAVRFVFMIGVVPGTLFGGWLAQAHGPRLSIAVAAIGYLIVALAAAAVPAIRRDRR